MSDVIYIYPGINLNNQKTHGGNNMQKSKKLFRELMIGRFLPIFLLLSFCLSTSVAQDADKPVTDDEKIITVALEMMKDSHYCGLITLDENGRPQVRTMNPYPQTDDLVIWFATKRDSRKVKEILNDPHVCVYYANHEIPAGYVAISGTAEIIDDKQIVIDRKREYWVGSIPDWENTLVLLKITPETIDIVNYKNDLTGNSLTWRSPTVKLENEEPK